MKKMKKLITFALALTMVLSTMNVSIMATDAPATNATITITADDAYDLYVEGVNIGANNDWRTVSTFDVFLPANYLVAVKAMDEHQVIAGLSVKIEFDDTSIPIVIARSGAGWTQSTELISGWESPATSISGWDDVVDVADDRWTTQTGLPDWVWTSNYVVGVGFDTVVYFRYEGNRPATPYELSYPVTAVSLPVGVATFTGTGSFAYNQGYSVAYVDVATNYEFLGWSLGDSTDIINEEDIYSGTMGTEAVALVANFKDVTPVSDPEPEVPTPPTPIPTPTPTPIPTPTPTPTEKVINYILTVSATEGGTVPGFMGTNTFSSGTNVNLNPVAQEGYEFTGWTGDVTNNVVVMTSSKSVMANFELIVVDEEVVQAAPVEVPVVVEEDTILDEVTPEAAPELISEEVLPQTGGLPIEALSLMGMTLVGLGVSLKIKIK